MAQDYERLRVSRYTGLDVNTARIHMDEGAARKSNNFDFRRIGAARLRPGYARLNVLTLGKTEVATDSFNRADGALGSNWTQGYSPAPVISSNRAVGAGGGGDGTAFWNGGSFGNDQYSRATVQGTTYQVGVCVRGAAGRIGYALVAYYGGTLYFYRGTSTSLTTIGGWVFHAVAIGDTIEIQVVGDHLYGFVNDTLVIEATDTVITSGRPGILAGLSSGILDDWSGGTIAQQRQAVKVAAQPSRLLAFERDDDESRLIVANGPRLEMFGETLPEWGT